MDSIAFITDLQNILNDVNLNINFNFFNNSVYVVLPADIELTTLTIVKFANFAKKYKCTFNISNYCDKLTFSFKF